MHVLTAPVPTTPIPSLPPPVAGWCPRVGDRVVHFLLRSNPKRAEWYPGTVVKVTDSGRVVVDLDHRQREFPLVTFPEKLRPLS